MIKFENVEVVGWEAAIRGMRNPMNSWEKIDSYDECVCKQKLDEDNNHFPYCLEGYKGIGRRKVTLGPNDYELMTKLRNAGTDHRKFMWYIDVYLDVTAPLYWWKEFKTYRKGRKFLDDEDFFDYQDDDIEDHIEMNSCSTMHKIGEREFTLEDFSAEHLLNDEPIPGRDYSASGMMLATMKNLNIFRELFLETKDKKYWWQMIQLLPSSYNQRRTLKLNYEVLTRMYKSRKGHKLDEWKDFCKWIERLPYSELITGKPKGCVNEEANKYSIVPCECCSHNKRDYYEKEG